MGLLRPGRPGLIGIAAGTAVMAGTAGAVRHHQEQKYAQKDYEQQAAAAPQRDDLTTQLEQLAQLKNQGILTEDEFQAKKKQILGI